MACLGNEFDIGDVPRTIYTYWHQGFAEAPAVVQACIARLMHMNKGWQIYTLDRNSVNDFVPAIDVYPDKLSQLSFAHRSDLIRTRLLIDNGGVWVDPTVFVSQPFDDWLIEKSAAGLFVFSRPGRDRLISNWFIASAPRHPILSRLYDELCAYWNHNTFRNFGRSSTYLEQQLQRVINRNLDWPGFWFSWPARKILRMFPYMVYHYLFYRLIKKDLELEDVFRQMPIVSADGPHRLQRIGLDSRFNGEAERVLQDKSIPLQKLSYKTSRDGIAPGSVLENILTIASGP